MNHILEIISKHLTQGVLFSLAGIGVYTVASLVPKGYSYLESLRSSFSSSNLQARYGKNSWALVTGAAQGMGEAWSVELASQKFNLILIDRSPGVHELASSLEKKYNIQAKSLKVDVTSEGAIDEIVSIIGSHDLSILVNNVGVLLVSEFTQQKTTDIQRLIKINVESVVLLTHRILPILKKRKERSAIIFMSSYSAMFGTPYMSAYSGSKAFLRFFGLSLSGEVKDKIDVLNLTPNLVSTRMTNFAKVGKFITSPTETVKGGIQKLGRQLETSGSKKHDALINLSYKAKPEKLIEANGKSLLRLANKKKVESN